MMLTRCQDHILAENIWFVWSKTSYSGDVTNRTNKAGLQKLLQLCSGAARKWRENEEMKRKWRENEEIERKWRENEEMDRE